MAMPSPASDNMEIDFAMITGISIFHLNEMSDQVRPIMLEYVFGFLISFLQTIINISLVIILAGGIVFAPPSSPLLCSSSPSTDNNNI